MREELLKGLTEEQIAKVKACKNSEEILALAKAEGVTLSDEQLEAVSGGGCADNVGPLKKEETYEYACPKCNSHDTTHKFTEKGISHYQIRCDCKTCGHVWFINAG